MPLLVLGRFAAGNTTRTVFALGDSITGGTGDLYGANIPNAAGSSYAMRACLDGSGTGAVPLFNAGSLPYPLAAWNTAHACGLGGRSDPYRKALMAYADVVTTAFGINDMNDLTPEQTQPLYRQLWRTCARARRRASC